MLTAAWVGFAAPAFAGDCQSFLMPVYVDDEVAGDAPMFDCGGKQELEMAGAVSLLQRILLPKEAAKIAKQEKNAKDRWPLGTARHGITFVYDEANVRLSVEVPADKLKPNSMQLARYGEDIMAGEMVEPAGLSAFSNLYAAQSYSSGAGMMQGWMPLRLDADAAVNVKGTVLEGSVNYVEGASTPFMADNVRLVKDDTERMLRYQAGELSYPVTGFQGYRQMAGVGVARNFSLQPYRVTSPAGRSNFTLQTASTVEVFVNNQRVRTLQLKKGTYELRDFPVVNGVNNVLLRITDAYGRVEDQYFPVVSDADLLEPGTVEFSFNAGVEVEKVGRQKNYDTDEVLASGIVRYGLMQGHTVGLNAQGSEDAQLVGLEHVMTGKLGAVQLEVAGHQADGNVGYGWRAEYRNILEQNLDGRDDDQSLWSASVERQGESFNVLEGSNPFQYDFNLGYSRNVGPEVTLSAGAGYRLGRDTNPDEQSVTGGVYWRPRTDWSLSANATYNSISHANVMLGLSWVPTHSNYQMNSSFDAQAETLRVDGSRISPDTNGWDLRAGTAVSTDENTVTGSAMYNGSRGFISTNHDLVTTWSKKGKSTEMQTGTGMQTRLQAGTAVVYADGKAAVSKPIQNSFVIVASRKSLKGQKLGINPANDGKEAVYEARSGIFGPAVLSDVMPYVYRRVEAEPTKNTDGEIQLGSNIVTVKPGYKSGTRVDVGTSAVAYASGIIADENGVPLALEGGRIVPESEDGEVSLLFTNREGEFNTSPLKPGVYHIHLAAHPRQIAQLTVPEEASGRIMAGTLKLGDRF